MSLASLNLIGLSVKQAAKGGRPWRFESIMRPSLQESL
jgi:hypothetical protein